MFLLLALLSACGGDPCRSLCTDVTRELAGCLDGWGYTWEDLGAESRAGWRAECQAEWDATRAALEARQLPDAEGRCEEASTALDALTCDELWAIYF